ncbi:MAG: PAS domain-containing sensor histidine kinase [Alphaproteobacteria bacterium]|nr:PAS domain-containing sensor histidine kinase [Alphaproteobacteria bacterium]
MLEKYFKIKLLKHLSFSRKWRNRFAALLVLASIISGIATYAALTETPPLGNDASTVIWLLNVDFIILLMLVVLIARRVVVLWSGKKRDLAGSHLHVRLVYIFSILAAAPAIIMTVFSLFFFHYGVQTWFSQRVQTAISESHVVAKAYLEEHKQVIKADILAMANDLNRQARHLISNEKVFEQVMRTQALFRNLSEGIVFDSSGNILARSGLTFSLEFEDVPQYAIRHADDGDVVITTGANDDRVRALVKLNNMIDTYLYVGRMVDPQVLSHVTATRQASEDYAELQAHYLGLQITVTMIFVIVGLVLLFVAIWFGLILSRQLVSPIITLITTVDRVRAGDLSARVPKEDVVVQEFDYLAHSFNRMTEQIQEQQNELITANKQLDRRRRFTETVLEGVSSGVIGVNENDKINLANNSAIKLLGTEERDIVGLKIETLLPELKGLLAQAHTRRDKITQAEILIERPEETRRTFLVRIAIELIGDKDTGAIITFDDITTLQFAQRKAAWADVARRIAHEIKNPLTPIQLSAERLKNKYLKQIKDDPETFSKCTDTIIKHVSDIGRMVNEFSSFARMPEPVMIYEDLGKQIEETLFLHRQAHPNIKFNLIGFDENRFYAQLDSQQIRQALNNLLQNSIDSILCRIEQDKKDGIKGNKGQINLVLALYGDDEIVLVISDNGLGLPKDENPVLLSEPYVTHKPKGTGLGLAIVKKIMEDHRGHLVLDTPKWIRSIKGWKNINGATIALVFPYNEEYEEQMKSA